MNNPLFVLIHVVIVIGLLIIVIYEVVQLLRENIATSGLRIIKVIIFSVFLFSFLGPSFIDGYIESMDWKLFKNKRIEIIKQVKNGDLLPNVNRNVSLCKLPFEFPIISNGGNEIIILRNNNENSLTVSFWIFRNYLDNPSSYFVYTNDDKLAEKIEEKIKRNPIYNWKMEENWYRVSGRIERLYLERGIKK